jgi:hypothetical protein
MTIPKFTAENSLYQSSGNYRIQSDIIASNLNVVVPQLWCITGGNGDMVCGDGGGFWADSGGSGKSSEDAKQQRITARCLGSCYRRNFSTPEQEQNCIDNC